MSYQVIARKWRPQRFEEVTGQEAITRTLQNALTAQRFHHAYIFSGPRGCGKTTTARILAKAFNCIKGATASPCGQCDSCREITFGNAIDVLEIDAASNTGVDNVREVIINTVAIQPARDRYKIFIIDEVHMLSMSAFNALLKTLEEPPSHVVFILATTELHKLPQTILSRCQHFEFRTIAADAIAQRLQLIAQAEQIQIDAEALLLVAIAGQGSMRDAQSAFDQVISFAGKVISVMDVQAALGLISQQALFTTMQAVATGDEATLMRLVAELSATGQDLRQFCRELLQHLRNLLIFKTIGYDAELLTILPSDLPNYRQQAEAFGTEDLLRYFQVLTNIDQDLRQTTQSRLQLEVGLLKLVQVGRLQSLQAIVERLTAVEALLRGGNLSLPTAGQVSTDKVTSSAQLARSQPPSVGAMPTSRPTNSGFPAQTVGQAAGNVSGNVGREESFLQAPPAPTFTAPVAPPVAAPVAAPADWFKEILDSLSGLLSVYVEKAVPDWQPAESKLTLQFSQADSEAYIRVQNDRSKVQEAASKVLKTEVKVVVQIEGGPTTATIAAGAAKSDKGGKKTTSAAKNALGKETPTNLTAGVQFKHELDNPAPLNNVVKPTTKSTATATAPDVATTTPRPTTAAGAVEPPPLLDEPPWIADRDDWQEYPSISALPPATTSNKSTNKSSSTNNNLAPGDLVLKEQAAQNEIVQQFQRVFKGEISNVWQE
jgi:DNA polymerase III subunit gamma/tau